MGMQHSPMNTYWLFWQLSVSFIGAKSMQLLRLLAFVSVLQESVSVGPNLGPVTIGKLLNLSVPQLLPLEKEFVTASTQYGCCRD